MTTLIQKLIQKYGGAVPRYTSYPTAIQFRDCLTNEKSIPYLKTIEDGEFVSLYIHIPYCHSLCHYCGCHTKIVNNTSIISAYIDTVCHEIKLVAAQIPKTISISRIHFGGGSPNYASLKDIKKIINTIHKFFPNSIISKIDMECDPRLLSHTKITELASLGVERVSLGIQDFDEKVQKAINRIQTLEHITSQVEALRRNNIYDINFDLIIGLPEQTLQSVIQSLERTIKIRPSRIAMFSYAHVPWIKKHQKLLEKFSFPSPEERFHMQEAARQNLCAAGYHPIGIDHYALSGDSLLCAQKTETMQRNFQGYTDDTASTILGFGLSAISQFKRAYTQNTLDSLSYSRFLEKDELPTNKECPLNPEDEIARNAIMQIMCYFYLDIQSYPISSINSRLLTMLEEDGIVIRDNGAIIVTEIGKPFTRIVASCFDKYLQKTTSRIQETYAKAI